MTITRPVIAWLVRFSHIAGHVALCRAWPFLATAAARAAPPPAHGAPTAAADRRRRRGHFF